MFILFDLSFQSLFHVTHLFLKPFDVTLELLLGHFRHGKAIDDGRPLGRPSLLPGLLLGSGLLLWWHLAFIFKVLSICKFFRYRYGYKYDNYLGGSPGLVVMGGDSFAEGCGFKSQRHILDGHFSHIFNVKIVMFV